MLQKNAVETKDSFVRNSIFCEPRYRAVWPLFSIILLYLLKISVEYIILALRLKSVLLVYRGCPEKKGTQ